ncbi:MAG: hypothetical protein OES79_13835 [Planctomycetota bacterium]|nr:hypothetical protein [Planctomycetota bacterium]
MAAPKEKLGLQIALIIFVLLTIVLSVTSYIFYDKYRTELNAKAAVEDKTKEAEKARKTAESQRDTLKQLVGKGPADPVDVIIETFERHQDIYGGTLPDETAKVYPTMLESQQDQVRELQEQIVSYQAEIAAEKAKFAQSLKESKEQVDSLQTEFKGQAEDIRKIHEEFKEQSRSFEKSQESVAQQVAEKQEEVLAIRKEAKDKEATMREKLQGRSKEINELKNELKPYRTWETEPPDGKVVSINPAAGTVFIDLGSKDGLRRQTTFSVVPHDVKNALNMQPKGALEVVRITDARLAEARITEDILSNPIVPGDRIVSPIFRAGQPERFAVAGLVDLSGDGSSDLRQLITLIKRNGGLVDAYVDDGGRRTGRISPATKFLITGEPPDEKSEKDVRDAYGRMLDDAEEYAVGQMPLDDFLEYIGYRGRTGTSERSSLSSRTRGKSSPFRRRPTTKKSAYD